MFAGVEVVNFGRLWRGYNFRTFWASFGFSAHGPLRRLAHWSPSLDSIRECQLYPCRLNRSQQAQIVNIAEPLPSAACYPCDLPSLTLRRSACAAVLSTRLDAFATDSQRGGARTQRLLQLRQFPSSYSPTRDIRRSSSQDTAKGEEVSTHGHTHGHSAAACGWRRPGSAETYGPAHGGRRQHEHHHHRVDRRAAARLSRQQWLYQRAPPTADVLLRHRLSPLRPWG